ncbi:MAG TPA: GNAT family N-acetyltransferase [Rhizomicrobium sp.]
MSDVTFRHADKNDVPAIVAMLSDDDIGESRESATQESAPVYERAFEDMNACPDNYILLAEIDGQLVGSLQLVFIPGLSRQGAKRAIIEAVRVKSAVRGQSIGTALMKQAIMEAREAGCKLVQLTSDRRRTRAHLFYRRLGFEQSHVGFKLDL